MISLFWNNLLAFEKYLIRTLKTGNIWLRGYSTQICWTSPPTHHTYSKVGRKQQASDFTITSLVFVSLFHPDLNSLARSSQSSPALSTLTLWLSMRVNHSVSLMSDFYKYPINLFKMPPKTHKDYQTVFTLWTDSETLSLFINMLSFHEWTDP